MVQKEAPTKSRGRPRAYEPALVLQKATEAFWRKGYAGTSVDDLSQATGLNKPSLYAGFGDKQALYRLALHAYIAQVGQGMATRLQDKKLNVRQAFDAIVQQAIALYANGKGCFLVATSPAVAWDDQAVRQMVSSALASQDAAFAARCKQAQQAGELLLSIDAAAMGTQVSALLHTLALRARAGASSEALQALAKAALDHLLKA